jgi:hypothetical protein
MEHFRQAGIPSNPADLQSFFNLKTAGGLNRRVGKRKTSEHACRSRRRWDRSGALHREQGLITLLGLVACLGGAPVSST